MNHPRSIGTLFFFFFSSHERLASHAYESDRIPRVQGSIHACAKIRGSLTIHRCVSISDTRNRNSIRTRRNKEITCPMTTTTSSFAFVHGIIMVNDSTTGNVILHGRAENFKVLDPYDQHSASCAEISRSLWMSP